MSNAIILANRNIDFFLENLVKYAPNCDQALLEHKPLDTAFLNRAGKNLDIANLDIDRIFLSYYLNDELAESLEDQYFEQEGTSESGWTNIDTSSSTDLDVGTIEYGHYVKYNVYNSTDTVYGKVVDMDVLAQTLTVESQGTLYDFRIDEVYGDKTIFEIQIGDIIVCTRLSQDQYGQYGNQSTLEITRNNYDGAEHIDGILKLGVTQPLRRSRNRCKISMKYKVMMDHAFAIPSSLLNTFHTYFRTENVAASSMTNDTVRYLSLDAIESKDEFIESYSVPPSGYAGKFSFGTSLMHRRVKLIYDSTTNIDVNLDTLYSLYTNAATLSTFTFASSGDNLDFSYQGQDVTLPVTSVSVSFSGANSITSMISTINAAISGAGSLTDCYVEQDSTGSVERIAMICTTGCIRPDSTSSANCISVLGLTTGSVYDLSMSSTQLKNKINSAISTAGISLSNFYLQAFDGGIIRIFSKEAFEIVGTGYEDQCDVIGFVPDVYDTLQKSIYHSIIEDILSQIDNSGNPYIAESPKINILSKDSQNAMDVAKYDVTKYSIDNLSSTDLYLEKLEYVDTVSGWLQLLNTIKTNLLITQYCSINSLDELINAYYDHYDGLYNCWRNFEARSYDSFDAIDLFIDGGKVKVAITDITVEWIENPNLKYISHLLGWDLDSYSNDLALINNTNFVRDLIHVYKSKGTHYAYKLMFKLMGLNITIDELYRGFPLSGEFGKISHAGIDPRKNAFYDTIPFTGANIPEYYTNGPGVYKYIQDGMNNITNQGLIWQEIWSESEPTEDDPEIKKQAWQYLQLIEKHGNNYRHPGGWYLNKSNRIRLWLDLLSWRTISGSTMDVWSRWVDFLKPIHLIFDEKALKLPVLRDKVEKINESIDFEAVLELVDDMYYDRTLFYKPKYFHHKHSRTGSGTIPDPYVYTRFSQGTIDYQGAGDNGYRAFKANGDGEWVYHADTGLYEYTGTITIVHGFEFRYDGQYYDGKKRYYSRNVIDWISDRFELGAESDVIHYGQGTNPALAGFDFLNPGYMMRAYGRNVNTLFLDNDVTLPNGVPTYGGVMQTLMYNNAKWKCENWFEESTTDPTSGAISGQNYVFSPFVYDRRSEYSGDLILDNELSTNGNVDQTVTPILKNTVRWLDPSKALPVVYRVIEHSKMWGKCHDVYYSYQTVGTPTTGASTSGAWPLFKYAPYPFPDFKSGMERALLGTVANPTWSGSKEFKVVFWLNRGGYDLNTGIPLDLTDLTTNSYLVTTTASDVGELITNLRAEVRTLFDSTTQPFGTTSGANVKFFEKWYEDWSIQNFASLSADGKLMLTHNCDFMVLPCDLNDALGVPNNSCPNIYSFFYTNIYGMSPVDNLNFVIENNVHSRWRNADTGTKQIRHLRYEPDTFADNWSTVYDKERERYVTYAKYMACNATGKFIPINVRIP